MFFSEHISVFSEHIIFFLQHVSVFSGQSFCSDQIIFFQQIKSFLRQNQCSLYCTLNRISWSLQCVYVVDVTMGDAFSMGL